MSTTKGTLFGISEDHQERSLSLDQHFIKNKTSTFFFKMEDKAQTPLILPGDILIVDRSIRHLDQRIVIASIYGSMICRYLFKKGQSVLLKPGNQNFESIWVTEEMDMILFGVVTAIARELN
ncbi:MAG: hypothetical protein ISR65_01520 [Bacteriovoracaceae bacterium]|nr:hypothetical protein [Bacteriovoracaceae bacterium]